MFLKIQSEEHGNWTYQVKRRFTVHVKNQSYDETFSNFDFDFSSFDEENVQKWKESGDKSPVLSMTFLDEDLKEISMVTNLSANIYLLNDDGKTIDIINRAS